ncbi:hypothetical protein [Endozoicomonas sp.]|uniref:hypothetical protein n=1 Tax=Endozoicomonas sp. TaxID=1892382 RepID=UPI003AF9858E
MAYDPSASTDFIFSEQAYQPAVDFAFYPQKTYAFTTPPSVVRFCQSHWQTSQPQQRDQSAAYGSSLTIDATRAQSSHQATPLEAHAVGLFWGEVASLHETVQISHGQSQGKENRISGHWQQSPTKQSHQRQGWDNSLQPQDQRTEHDWQTPAEKDALRLASFHRVDEFSPPHQQENLGYRIPEASLLNFQFAGQSYTPATSPDVFFRMGRAIEQKVIQPRDSRTGFSFQSNRDLDEPVVIPWGLGQKARDESVTGNYGGETDPNVVEKPQPEQPEIRESYLLMNVISVVTLPERTPIELNDVEIELDIDSFSWSLTGQLWGASSLAMIEPDASGPKQVEININGWVWVFIIERYSTDRRFGHERYTVTGSSRSQLLAAPYAPKRSKSSASDINAKQAITEELANTGFTASYPDLNDYSTPDWIIPGGTFSYQHQTPMEVIARLTTSAGSVVIPARDSDQLNIQPRYPASPWNWGTATMDRIIPASMVISLSASWRPEPQYNAVYVSGTHAGVAVNVKRSGTAGDEPAPDILEDWLTETQVNTERGRNELAKGGHQSITTIELPLTDTNTAPGLIEPGMLVEVQDITGDWQGLCLRTHISASGGLNAVIQSVELERHY